MPSTAPTATYRLQLHGGFGFDAAAEIVPYLSDLGVSHLYLSPVLQAAPGSMHGYDVVDHGRVSTELGGEAGLVKLAETAHQHDLGIVVDVVPNHMAIPAPEHLNRQLWTLLRDGREADSARWFDLDWDVCGGRIGLPVLGGPLDDTLAAGELVLDNLAGEVVVRYHDHVFPVAPGTEGQNVAEVLARQHYLLADWREKAEVLGYRRFFDVDALIAVRVELPEVFDATHRVLLDLHGRGVIDGFRIDHPDGLADPEGYLEMLRTATGGAWVVVEKILEGDERLPPSWSTAGTTGYDALRVIQAALTPAVGVELDERWRRTGGQASLSDTETDAKRQVVAELFGPEVNRLVRCALAAAADADGRTEEPASPLDEALTELLAHVDVYRAYLRPGHQSDQAAVTRLGALVARTREARPDLTGPLTLLHRLLADVWTDSDAGRDLVVRFQQVCGPVMAKGVEDTTFYRWHRLIALNEVGGDPASLDTPGVEPLHAWAAHQHGAHPVGMTTLSTHDNKRTEDVRSRLLALAEDLEHWDAVWEVVAGEADECRVDSPTAYLVMQTLVGAWPLDADRLSDYLRKAVREAKQHTDWNSPDQAYERRVLELGTRCLASNAVVRAVNDALTAITPGIRGVTLASKLLQLTLPGVPDLYQGCELVALSLVDPDNRRPVDFAQRRDRLARLDRDEPPADLDDDKLWLTSRVLRWRRQHPEQFGADASYTPLAFDTPHLVGFLRGRHVATVATRWPLAVSCAGWGAERVPLPAGVWVDVLTGEKHQAGDDGLRCADVLTALPVSLLAWEAS